ncbi:MAG TPA: efflux RND transporter periplasmic adaptor subunit [Steroidobacteraceae bacterium]|nr:efflux RND transporter periplasmic adaptor subunit [Steroidobacteraceae bacterium]
MAGLTASLFVLAACGKGSASDNASAAQAPLLLSEEDLLTVRNNALSQGPVITGSVQPERRADLRAEVSAVVLAVLKENGDPVKRGDLLVRLDDTSIRDTLTSATAAENAAAQAFEQAERQFQRMRTLRETGIVSAQQLEDAENRRNTAQSDREAARARVVTARQQLQRTEVRAPFDGIVSDRKVSAGDTAQIGKELLKVIDPNSLRFEGLVSAENIGAVKVGQPVMFRVNGFGDREFIGTIARVNPAANATTRQVEVLVTFDNQKDTPNVAGLYAEGRIETHRTSALTLPPSALVREGDNAYAWRVKDRSIQKVALQLGDRDPRSGEFVLKSGLAEGDTVLRYPTTTLANGQPIELAQGASLATASRK